MQRVTGEEVESEQTSGEQQPVWGFGKPTVHLVEGSARAYEAGVRMCVRVNRFFFYQEMWKLFLVEAESTQT